MWFALDILIFADGTNMLLFDPDIGFDSLKACQGTMEVKKIFLSDLFKKNVLEIYQTCIEIPYLRGA